MIKLNFKKRLNLGFGIVYAIIIFVAGYSLMQLYSIQNQVELIYNHPFMVSNAVKNIKIEYYRTAFILSKIDLVKSESQLDSLVDEVTKCDKIIDKNLKLVYGQYLGNRSDVDSLYHAIIQWEIIKGDLYKYKNASKKDSIHELINAKNQKWLEKLETFSTIISDFAENKAQTALNKSLVDKKQTLVVLIFILIVILLLVFIISYFIFNREIRSNNEQLLNFNKILETKVLERTLELQVSEERFRSSFENSAIGMALAALNGNFTQVNQSFCSMLGFKKEELLTKSFQQITHPDDLQIDIDLVNKTIQGETSYFQTEKKYIDRYNKIVWANVSVSLVRDEKEQPLHFIAQIENITSRKLAIEKLKHEEYLLHTLMDNIPASIYFKDRESRLIRSNIAQMRKFGLANASEAIGKTDFDFFSYEHAQLAFNDEQEIINTGNPILKEEKETWPNQPDTWVSTIKMPLRDKEKKIIGTFGISIDITKRKLAEEALFKSKELFSTMFRQAPIGIALINTSSGKILEANEMYQKLVDRKLDELQATTWMLYTHPDDVELNLKKMKLLSEGQIKSFQLDERYIHKNDKMVWVNKTIAKINDPDKNNLFHLCMVEDITEKKLEKEKIIEKNLELIASEEKLQSANKKLSETILLKEVISNQYQKLFENLTVGFALHEIILDENDRPADYVFLKINPAFERLTGLIAENLIGKTVMQVMPMTEKYWIENYGQVAITGKDIEFENYALELNKYYYVHAYSPQHKQFAVIIEDVTNRKLTEIQLKETNKSLEEMVYIASHDLQVPLVSMEGYATELLENYGYKFDDEGKYCLTRLQSNARRMHKLVLSLLDLSRLNTKKPNMEKFSLQALIEKVSQDLSLTIEKHGAKVIVDILPQLLADKIRIEGVFRNLIINALNYGGKNISLGYENQILYVKDDGIGIPESQLQRIFNAGERLKKNKAEGVGMGLTFCLKVIEQHKGQIWAESEGENKGTTFYIKLPSHY